MARKEPFRRFSVLERICVALEKKREEESAVKARVPPLNTYVEEVLWEFAMGRITRAGSAPAGGKIAAKVEGPEYPHLQEYVADRGVPESKDVHKQNRPKK